MEKDATAYLDIDVWAGASTPLTRDCSMRIASAAKARRVRGVRAFVGGLELLAAFSLGAARRDAPRSPRSSSRAR